jgi:ribosomal protein S18 acetylase RimI-like enzyme
VTATDLDLDLGRRAVRRSTAQDAGWASTVLADAFDPDPIFRWCIPEARQRARHLPEIFAAVVAGLAAHDETYVAAGQQGVALWVPPGAAPLAEAAEQVLGERVGQLPAADADRFAAISAAMAEHHPHDPHWYLWFVAVHPSAQGRGIGGTLLEDMLVRCDVAGRAAYLEATTESSLSLYQRHGFRVIGELTAAGSPPMWPMWREPRTS